MLSDFGQRSLVSSQRTDGALLGKPFGIKLLNLGLTASLVCAIECAITPIILIVLPLIVGAATWHQLSSLTESFDRIDVMLMGVVGIVGLSSQLVTLSIHQRLGPIATMGFGFLILICGRFLGTGDQLGEFLFTLCGAGAMIVGGIWSRRLCGNGHHALCSQDHGPSCTKD